MNPHAGTSGVRPPFTSTQWQELEHQALIFKYMIAGMPVPPDLLLPIRASLDSSRFFQHPALGYCSFYGKKADPEPGRCRRTDGKKWRCSKDAHPDSKYCERHMHRGRNRSRKPVESPAAASQPTSSTVAAVAVAGGGSGSGTPSACNFDGLPLHASVSGHLGSQASQLLVDPNDYGMSSKDYRYLQGVKGDVDEHSFFSEASGSVRGLGMDSTAESSWRLLPSRVSSFPPAKQRSSGIWQGNFPPQVQGLHDIEPASLASAIPKQQQHCFFGNEIGSSETVKQEGQPLRPFFDEWPKTRDSWSDLDDDRSNRSSFSTTQLSISIPMTSSDFSATSSRSPNDD